MVLFWLLVFPRPNRRQRGYVLPANWPSRRRSVSRLSCSREDEALAHPVFKVARSTVSCSSAGILFPVRQLLLALPPEMVEVDQKILLSAVFASRRAGGSVDIGIAKNLVLMVS